MRSEGDGHLHPRNFPDLTWQEAWQKRSIQPLIANLFNAYNPSFQAVLKNAENVAKEFDFEAHRVPLHVGCVRRAESSHREFDLLNPAGQLVGRARHVVLALGHAGIFWPPEFEEWRGDPRVVHSYEKPTMIPGERVVIVGGGITAVHLWHLALNAGAEVIALHRNPLHHQPLNAPRCMFNETGIRAYRRLSPDQRLALFKNAESSSYPWRFSWERDIQKAVRAGRFHYRQAALEQIKSGLGQDSRLTLWFDDRTAVEADRLIFATGFNLHARSYPLVRQLVDEYPVRVNEGILQVADNFTLPPLTQKNSVCAVIGALSRWALPVADTFFGMKYASRRLVPLLKM